MRTMAAVFILCVSAGATLAQSRPSTPQLTCEAARGVVQSRGAAVLSTGGSTFDRFVRDQSFCFHGQVLKATFVPTVNNSQCLVGFRCFDPSNNLR